MGGQRPLSKQVWITQIMSQHEVASSSGVTSKPCSRGLGGRFSCWGNRVTHSVWSTSWFPVTTTEGSKQAIAVGIGGTRVIFVAGGHFQQQDNSASKILLIWQKTSGVYRVKRCYCLIELSWESKEYCLWWGDMLGTSKTSNQADGAGCISCTGETHPRKSRLFALILHVRSKFVPYWNWTFTGKTATFICSLKSLARPIQHPHSESSK